LVYSLCTLSSVYCLQCLLTARHISAQHNASYYAFQTSLRFIRTFCDINFRCIFEPCILVYYFSVDISHEIRNLGVEPARTANLNDSRGELRVRHLRKAVHHRWLRPTELRRWQCQRERNATMQRATTQREACSLKGKSVVFAAAGYRLLCCHEKIVVEKSFCF
jgi:hypothetical protein